MNWKRILVGIIVVVLLAIGGYFVYQQFIVPEPEAVEPAPSSEEEGEGLALNPDQVNFVIADGEIVPLRDATVSPQIGGSVVEIVSEVGEQVTQGDPILKLDATDQEIAVTQAQAALLIAEANLQAALAGLEAAKTGEKAADVALQAVNVELALTKAEPTDAEIALSESAVALGEAGIDQAVANQSVVAEGPTNSQIQAAEAQLRAAEAQLLPVREALDVLKREESPDEDALTQAQRRYNAAVANVTAAEAAVNDARAGANSGQRAAAFGGVTGATAQRDAAQAQLDLLLAGTREERITVAEAGVAQAEAAVADAGLNVVQAESAVAQAEAGIAQAEAALESAEDALSRMTITAPFDGVVAEILAEQGEVVQSGSPVIQVADFDGWLIKTIDLSELQVVRINVGDRVEVSEIDAIPGESLEGIITDIATVSRKEGGDTTYEVTISLDDTKGLPLRWGMTVAITVDVADQ